MMKIDRSTRASKAAVVENGLYLGETNILLCFSAKDISGMMQAENVQSEDLQVQNENLLQIIHQMREDMEDLTKQLSQRTAGSAGQAENGAPITEGSYRH